MTREDKTAAIEALKEKFAGADYFYVADASTMTVAQVNKFRRLCFEQGVEMTVVKNTLAKKALESFPEGKNYSAIFDALHGPTALLFAEVANVPARLLKKFREGGNKPVLKAAYIDTAVYHGDDQLDALTRLKSKEEVLGDLLGLLQSPMSNILSGLQSAGGNIVAVLKTLEERAA